MPVVTRSTCDGSRVFKVKTRMGHHVRILGTSNRNPIYGGKAIKPPKPPPRISLPLLDETPCPVPTTIKEPSQDTVDNSYVGALGDSEIVGEYPLANYTMTQARLNFIFRRPAEEEVLERYDDIADARLLSLPSDGPKMFKPSNLEPYRSKRITVKLMDDALFESGVEAEDVFSRRNTEMYLRGLGYTKKKHAMADKCDNNGFFVIYNPIPGTPDWYDGRYD